jgi:hypothetical protein
MVTLWSFSAGLAPGSLGLAPIVSEGSRRDVRQLKSDTGRHAFGWWQRSAAGTADCGNQEQNEGELKGVTHWTDGRKSTMRANGSPGEELPPLSQSDAKKSQIPDGPRSKYRVGETSSGRGRGRKVLTLPRSQRATGSIRKRRLCTPVLGYRTLSLKTQSSF